MFRFQAKRGMLSNKIVFSQDYCLFRDRTLACGWDHMLTDGSLFLTCLLWRQHVPGSVCDGEGCWQQPWGLSDLRSGRLRKSLAAILSTDVRSVLGGKFSSRWSFAVKKNLFWDQLFQHLSIALLIFTMAVWQWPGVRAVTGVCCLKEKGDLGQCSNSLCWRRCACQWRDIH